MSDDLVEQARRLQEKRRAAAQAFSRSRRTAGGGGSGLLNTYPANIAFSFRRLRSGATVACRIRRSSDNAESDFGFSGTAFDAAGAASFIGGGSGFIAKWYDQSGNGYDLSQTTAANQPTYNPTGYKSGPCVHWTSSTQSLSTVSLTGDQMWPSAATAYHIHAMSENDGEPSGVTFSWENASNHRWLTHYTFGDSLYADFGPFSSGRVSAAQPSGWVSNPHIVEAWRETGSVQRLRVDAVLLATANGQTGLISGGSSLLTFGSPWNGGRLAESLHFAADPGSTARDAIRDNLNSFYAVY